MDETCAIALGAKTTTAMVSRASGGLLLLNWTTVFIFLLRIGRNIFMSAPRETPKRFPTFYHVPSVEFNNEAPKAIFFAYRKVRNNASFPFSLIL